MLLIVMQHYKKELSFHQITKIFDCTKSKITPVITINAEEHPVDTEGRSLLPLTISELKSKAGQLGVELESGEGSTKALIRRAIIERSEVFQPRAVDIAVDKNESKTLWQQILKALPICR